MNFAKLRTDLSGKGLIAFSDPAGAKSCLALVWYLKQEHPEQELRLISNKNYPFFADWGFFIEVITDISTIDFSPFNWVFTGTSHPDSSNRFEVKCIQYAQKNAIPCFSFIDHWTNLALRFQEGDAFYFPEKIFVLSEQIKKMACADGIPENKLEVLVNPYLSYIQEHWKSKLTQAEFYHHYQIPAETQQVFVYAPDPISLRFTNLPFDEVSVCVELLHFFQQHPTWFVIIKTHPLQNVAYLRNGLAAFDNSFFYIDDTNLVENLEVMYHSSAILGFFSNFLAEANALQKPVFRYVSSKNDEFESFFSNFSTAISSVDELSKLLNL